MSQPQFGYLERAWIGLRLQIEGAQSLYLPVHALVVFAFVRQRYHLKSANKYSDSHLADYEQGYTPKRGIQFHSLTIGGAQRTYPKGNRRAFIPKLVCFLAL